MMMRSRMSTKPRMNMRMASEEYEIRGFWELNY
jgi:hypothetical protein